MKSKSNRNKHIIVGFIWLTLQLILVFYETPVVFISDEILYRRISESLLEFAYPISLHYPILYPVMISGGFFFGNYFFEAMLIINIVVKGCCLIIIWKMLKRVTDEKRAFLISVMIAFSPIYFLYSRVLLSENLAAPLLIINVLYHEIYRKKLIDKSVKRSTKYKYTMIAAMLSLALFWTKYLFIVIFPIMCIFWVSVYLRENYCKKVRLKNFIEIALIYTIFVVGCIILYALYYASRIDAPFTFKLLTDTMGFSIGTGPANNGYTLMAEGKWLVSYLAYALLGAVPIIVAMIGTVKRELLCKNQAIYAVNLALVFFVGICGGETFHPCTI